MKALLCRILGHRLEWIAERLSLPFYDPDAERISHHVVCARCGKDR